MHAAFLHGAGKGLDRHKQITAHGMEVAIDKIQSAILLQHY
jgi:hypothetical protein